MSKNTQREQSAFNRGVIDARIGRPCRYDRKYRYFGLYNLGRLKAIPKKARKFVLFPKRPKWWPWK